MISYQHLKDTKNGDSSWLEQTQLFVKDDLVLSRFTLRLRIQSKSA